MGPLIGLILFAIAFFGIPTGAYWLWIRVGLPRRAAGLIWFLVLGGEVSWCVWQLQQLNGRMIERWSELQAEFPAESLEDRLHYENAAAADASQPILAASVQERLQLVEERKRDSTNSRYWALQQLHEQTAEEFAGAFGFGVMRLAGSLRGTLRDNSELPRTPPRIRQQGEVDVSVTPSDRPPASPVKLVGEQREQVVQLHRIAERDFLDPNTFGFVAEFRKAAEFQSHHFAKPPGTLSPFSGDILRPLRVELISLLKFESPRVYISEFLPNMAELSEVPTRHVDGFEADALGRLRTDEDVIIESTADANRMVGSLRAGKQCLQCHDVKRGELLGAFSYVLPPARAAIKSQ